MDYLWWKESEKDLESYVVESCFSLLLLEVGDVGNR